MDIGAYIFVVVISYLLGATPSGYLAGMACGVDVRSVGSGNIGATNVMRVLGTKAGAIVLAADALKGFVSARWIPLLGLRLFPSPGTTWENLALAGGVAAILGHVYTFWLKFKGGKGIATTGGVVLAWAPGGVFDSAGALGIGPCRDQICFTGIDCGGDYSSLRRLGLERERDHDGRDGGTELISDLQTQGEYPAPAHGRRKPHRKEENMNVTVIGAGAWGTALANLLCQNDHAVTLWGHDAGHLARVRETRENPRYLPGITLSPENHIPGTSRRSGSARRVPRHRRPVEIFPRSYEPISGFHRSRDQRGQRHRIRDRPDHVRPAQGDDAQGGGGGVIRPDAGVGSRARNTGGHRGGSSANRDGATRARALWIAPAFRVYTSQDVTGVELGGAIKNVVALAAGVGDGLGFGDNAKAGLVTRGLTEMRRLGVARGAHAETFSGLSGLGDLAVTCYSRLAATALLASAWGGVRN